MESESLWENGYETGSEPEFQEPCPMPEHTLSLVLIRRSDGAVWPCFRSFIPVEWNIYHGWLKYVAVWSVEEPPLWALDREPRTRTREYEQALAELDVVDMGRFGHKYAKKNVEYVYCSACWYPPDYDSDESTMYESESSGMPSSVRLANLKKISSSVLLGDWFQHPYGRRKGDWEEKKREYDGRWWTPRGQNPWAWAFGTP